MSVAPLIADELMEVAVRETGLPDFGPDSFLEGLRVLCESMNAEANLNVAGYDRVREKILDSLKNRLEIEDWISRHPETLDQQVSAPLIIVGMPRTGTTLLSNLLDLDPENRSLYLWEASRPVPPPRLGGAFDDPRVLATMRADQQHQDRVQGIETMTHYGATLPAECIVTLCFEFKSLTFEMLGHVPSYREWREQTSMVSAYRYHHKVLQLLQYYVPTQCWSLKSPAHLWDLPALTEVFPDAKLVSTHRDFAKVLPSVTNLNCTMLKTYSDTVDEKLQAEVWMHNLELTSQRAVDFEEARGKDALLHVDYHRVMKDPVAAINTLYHQAGKTMSPLFEARILAWLEQNPQGKKGGHKYSLEQFGLTQEIVRQRFSPFYDRYKIPAE